MKRFLATSEGTPISRVLAARFRARMLGWRGASVGAKTGVGARCSVDRPRGLSLGMRVFVESDVYFKIVSFQSRVIVGDFSFIGRGCEIDCDNEVRIGSHCLLAPGCFVTDHVHRIEPSQRIDLQGCRSAPVVIEDDVWLGARCVVLPGVTIGRGAVIGAGAVVTRDVPSMAVATGVPARVSRFR